MQYEQMQKEEQFTRVQKVANITSTRMAIKYIFQKTNNVTNKFIGQSISGGLNKSLECKTLRFFNLEFFS